MARTRKRTRIPLQILKLRPRNRREAARSLEMFLAMSGSGPKNDSDALNLHLERSENPLQEDLPTHGTD